VVFLVGPRGSGKTDVLEKVSRRLSDSSPTALIQVEPIAASPEILCERFHKLGKDLLAEPGQQASFDTLLTSLENARRGAVFLLDEVTEIRTLSYFPGVHEPMESFVKAMVASPSRFVATSRFPTLLANHLNQLPDNVRAAIEVVPLPPLAPEELRQSGVSNGEILASVTGGLPSQLIPLIERLEEGRDLSEALALELETGGHLERECRATHGELLHRARGYGACKAVLHVLASEQNLTLSEIARRLGRTAGSTRDYLRWLEEVELITVRDKRFVFVDPILRLWHRLYGQGFRPSESDIRNEVGAYIEEFGEGAEPVKATTSSEELIEID
jgi:predicted AAA+ superfamily ATPase